MTYRALDAGEILTTQARLCQRIDERFPGSGLGKVARDLLAVGRECAEASAHVARPNWIVRLAAGTVAVLLVLAVALGIWNAARLIGIRESGIGLTDFIQGLESITNEVILLSLALFFLASVENRLKRRVALKYLHQLRSLAHVVDMHQLTKDPDQLISSTLGTASSPKRTFTRHELGRYLDYCSELLSVTGKLAALFMQGFSDSLVLQAVNEVESLTSGLSRKIWQKITLLERAD